MSYAVRGHAGGHRQRCGVTHTVEHGCADWTKYSTTFVRPQFMWHMLVAKSFGDASSSCNCPYAWPWIRRVYSPMNVLRSRAVPGSKETTTSRSLPVGKCRIITLSKVRIVAWWSPNGTESSSLGVASRWRRGHRHLHRYASSSEQSKQFVRVSRVRGV